MKHFQRWYYSYTVNILRLILCLGLTSQVHADEIQQHEQEIIWLVDQSRYTNYIGCGNESWYSRPSEFGIIINELGEVIERAPTEVWATRVNTTHVVLTRFSPDGSPTTLEQRYKNIPTHTIISDAHRFEYTSDLVLRSIGNGWFRCDRSGSVFNDGLQRGVHPVDPSSTDENKFFYLDHELNQIKDIQSQLQINTKGHKIEWIIDPQGVFVLQGPTSLEQRILGPDNTISAYEFFGLKFKQPVSRKMGWYSTYTKGTKDGKGWLYNPKNDQMVMQFYWTMSTNASSEYLVLSEAEWEPGGIYNLELNRIGSLGYRHQPQFFTSENILVYNDRTQTTEKKPRIFKAFKVIEGAKDPLTEMDVSWIKRIDTHSLGPKYAVRNQSDELVIIDSSLNQILILPSTEKIIRITQSGRFVTLNTETNIYSLYNTDDQLVRVFDIVALLAE